MNKGTYTMECTEVQFNYKRKGDNYLHLVSFKGPNGQPYQAEEMTSVNGCSFLRGITYTFEVTHPGTNGKLDWIRTTEGNNYKEVIQNYNYSPSEDAGNDSRMKWEKENHYIQQAIIKEDTVTAQIAFQCAVQLGLKNDWSDAQIIEKAFLFAGNIKRIGKQIAIATDI